MTIRQLDVRRLARPFGLGEMGGLCRRDLRTSTGGIGETCENDDSAWIPLCSGRRLVPRRPAVFPSSGTGSQTPRERRDRLARVRPG
jgi:hypothetical protein